MKGPQAITPLPREFKLTPVAENYLLAIYLLREQGQRVTLTQLAEQLKRIPASEGLGTSLPTVAGMVRRMVREGLANTAANKDVVLMPKGQALAESVVRRHRLAERMVTDLLGLDLHKAHVEAHRLEHAISPDVEAKIVERLGNPTTCPFGHPIPGSGYKPASRACLTLAQIEPGQTFRVDRIPEEDPVLLEYLVANGVLPGRASSVEEAAPYRGVITLSVDGKDVVVGYQVAARIWVTPKT